jgi:glucose/arabinose dehydrogenase
MRILKKLSTFLLYLYMPWFFVQPAYAQDVLKSLRVPAGFSISVFANKVKGARSMALGENSWVFVGTGQEGKVYALADRNGDGVADERLTVAQKLFMPNGVAYRNGSLYVAEINRIRRFDQMADPAKSDLTSHTVYDRLPSDQHHGWKYLRFGPDGKLYTAVGAPCNICNPNKPIYASLVRLNPDGSQFEIIGRGIRNTVGFDWQPETNALFFTDNGRDWLGEDSPPDELNQWHQIDDNFGYPFCHGGTIPDPEFGQDKSCSDYKAPVWRFKAHSAPLGMRFYRGRHFPEKYRKQVFVAEHGSWNRKIPDGYRVALIAFTDAKPSAEEVFIDGWLTPEGKVLGRPVDILELPDGSLLISDDLGGVIYRVVYKG